jgi:hypothetical protein
VQESTDPILGEVEILPSPIGMAVSETGVPAHRATPEAGGGAADVEEVTPEEPALVPHDASIAMQTASGHNLRRDTTPTYRTFPERFRGSVNHHSAVDPCHPGCADERQQLV